MIFVLLGALVIGLSLGVFGSGGSVLTVPVLLYLLHHEDKVAIAESLGIVGAIALVSAIPYARARLVHWPTAFLFGVPGMLGTYVGAWIASYVTGQLQIMVFAGTMFLAAFLMWRNSHPSPSEWTPSEKLPVPKIAAEGFAVGALTGFVGVGGGFMIVPALVLLGGLPVKRAVATSLIIIAMKSTTGFWKYLRTLDEMNLSIDWTVFVTFVVIGALGSLVGKQLNARIAPNILQRAFAIFLVAMSLLVLARESWSIIAITSTVPAEVPIRIAHQDHCHTEQEFR